MVVNTTWSSPSTAGGSGGTDLAAGDTLSETVWDRVQSNLNRLGGADGDSKTGPYRLGASSSPNNTAGLTVQQGAGDDEIVSLRSTDVAHGVTGLTDTDTYGYAKKFSATAGGLTWLGLSETGVAFNLSGVATSEDTTTNNAAQGTIRLDANLKSGTGTTTQGTTANLYVLTNGGTTRLIVKGDGDVHNNGGSTAMGTYDAEDDGALVETVGTLMNPERVKDYRFSLARDLAAHREALERGGVITTDPATGEFFISYKGMLGLLIDAIRQVTHAHRTLAARVAPLLPAE